MSVGPITIFDKSALQALSLDEAVWLDNFYLCNITPLFFVETLADLEKHDSKRRPPEHVVGGLAAKTPPGGCSNVHHATLCEGELLGYPVEIGLGRPVLTGGQPVATSGQTGIMFQQAPEAEAFQRWQHGQFLEAERLFARQWRRALSGIDLRAIYEQYRPGPGERLRDLGRAREVAERLVRRDGRRFEVLKRALDFVGAPPRVRRAVIARWKSLGGPPLPGFAPFTAHVMTVETFFGLALGSELIGRERPSNKIDLAYLYYLPFCMVFASNDRLHGRCVPHFLTDRQAFVSGDELKADLAKLDAYYSALPAEVRARGVMAFAQHPPTDGAFLTTRLWDQFLPKWRPNLQREPLSQQEQARLAAHVNRMMDQAKPLVGAAGQILDTDTAGFLSREVKMPARRGKWQILPPEVCQ